LVYPHISISVPPLKLYVLPKLIAEKYVTAEGHISPAFYRIKPGTLSGYSAADVVKIEGILTQAWNKLGIMKLGEDHKFIVNQEGINFSFVSLLPFSNSIPA